jgi:hypothetical protein
VVEGRQGRQRRQVSFVGVLSTFGGDEIKLTMWPRLSEPRFLEPRRGSSTWRRGCRGRRDCRGGQDDLLAVSTRALAASERERALRHVDICRKPHFWRQKSVRFVEPRTCEQKAGDTSCVSLTNLCCEAIISRLNKPWPRRALPKQWVQLAKRDLRARRQTPRIDHGPFRQKGPAGFFRKAAANVAYVYGCS